MKWRKLGRIFNPDDIKSYWMNSHAAVPFCCSSNGVENKIIKIFFSSRDEKNRSNINWIKYDLEEKKIIEVSENPILIPGKLGTFDDSGVMGSCLIEKDNNKFLYYIGWNLGKTVPFRNSIGIAKEMENGNYEKLYEGPILDRTKEEPYFVASNCVLFDEGIYKIWYLSCVKWEKIENEIRHFYHIKYAESLDGINWERKGKVAIDFRDEYEYAISVPRVLKIDGKYIMWFSSRGSKEYPSYRIRKAESIDGVNWNRFDEIELNVSKEGWDSEMVCYPFVFEYKNKLYMLYNGNGYGKTGIGLSVLEEE